MTSPMHTAIREIESLLQQHKQTLQTARHPAQAPYLMTRFSAWLDSGAPVLIAITVAALLALAVGLASAAFAFMPATTAATTIITKTDALRMLTSDEISDRGYSRLKDRFCQAAFSGLIPTADRMERSDVRQKTEDESLTAALPPPSDLRAEKRQRKYNAGNRTRYRTSSSVQDQTKRQPSLLERFTGVRL